MKEYSFGAVKAIRNENVCTGAGPTFLAGAEVKNAHRVHRALADYAATPLVRLDGLAKKLGVKSALASSIALRVLPPTKIALCLK